FRSRRARIRHAAGPQAGFEFGGVWYSLVGMSSENGNSGNGHDPDKAEAERQSAVILDFRRPEQGNRPPKREPMFNLPPVTKYFILLLVIIHIALLVAGPA